MRKLTAWDAAWPILGIAILLVARWGVGRRGEAPAGKPAGGPPPPAAPARPAPPLPGLDLPRGEMKLCSGVVILLDTSSSMLQSVRDRSGRRRPKHEIAREALERIIDHTADWVKTHPDVSLRLGIHEFSSRVAEVLPMSEFDAARARSAIARIQPGSGTAIGRAIERGYRDLFLSGCVRKHIVCITDGDNTSGPAPDRIARMLFSRTEGEVQMHFVAFDTSARKFAFLDEVNGSAVEAADGAELQARLTDIYEKRILAEAMPDEGQAPAGAPSIK